MKVTTLNNLTDAQLGDPFLIDGVALTVGAFVLIDFELQFLAITGRDWCVFVSLKSANRYAASVLMSETAGMPVSTEDAYELLGLNDYPDDTPTVTLVPRTTAGRMIERMGD